MMDTLKAYLTSAQLDFLRKDEKRIQAVLDALTIPLKKARSNVKNQSKKILFVTDMFPGFDSNYQMHLYSLIMECLPTYEVYLYTSYTDEDAMTYRLLKSKGVHVHHTWPQYFSLEGLKVALSDDVKASSDDTFRFVYVSAKRCSDFYDTLSKYTQEIVTSEAHESLKVALDKYLSGLEPLEIFTERLSELKMASALCGKVYIYKTEDKPFLESLLGQDSNFERFPMSKNQYKSIHTHLENLGKDLPELAQKLFVKDLSLLEKRECGVATVYSQYQSTGQRGRILFICSEFPSWKHAGGLRVYDLIVHLQQEYDVYLYSIFNKSVDDETYKDLQLKGVKIHITSPEWFKEDGLELFVRKEAGLVEETPFQFALLEFAGSNVFLEMAQIYAEKIGFTFMESMARRSWMEYEASLLASASEADRLKYLEEFLSYVYSEGRAYYASDSVFFVTEQDLSFTKKIYNERSSLYVAPIWISKSQFSRVEGLPQDPKTILFIGNFWHEPNVLGLRWYLENVHDAVISKVPDAILQVVGLGGERIHNYLEGKKNVHVLGYVDYVNGLLQRATLTIAPVISGAGGRSKAIQSLFMNRRVVATDLGAEGLEIFSGQGAVLVSHNAQEFAANVIEGLQKPFIDWTNTNKILNDTLSIEKGSETYLKALKV